MLLIVSFAIIYTVWGSTYLAIRVAVETLPPFLLAGARFVVAGAVLLAWMRLRGAVMPRGNQWWHAAIAGNLMLVGGNGLVVWAEKDVPSNLAALIIALTPVWFAVLEWARPKGARPALPTVAGILVGFIGVAMLVSGHSPQASSPTVSVGAALMLIVAGLCWSGGTLWARYHPHTNSPWVNSAAQMLCGGVGLLLAAWLRGEPGQFHWNAVSVQSWLALLYLLVFGSWVAFSAYAYLLKATTPARLATYAYVNPVIAVLLGWLFLGETLTAQMMWASAVILASVAITSLPMRNSD